MRVRAFLVPITLAAVLVAVGARADRPEACFGVNPAAPPATTVSCGYGPATLEGGIDAIGRWSVTIVRPTPDGEEEITIDSEHLGSECVGTGPRTICPIGTIQPGDTVSALAIGYPSFVGVGNPCPVSNPGAPPPIAGGEC
jgi:hypothetical protein